jgi:D-xylose transport system ATP-binding protein
VLRLGRNNGMFDLKLASDEQIVAAITGATSSSVTRRAAAKANRVGEVE